MKFLNYGLLNMIFKVIEKINFDSVFKVHKLENDIKYYRIIKEVRK